MLQSNYVALINLSMNLSINIGYHLVLGTRRHGSSIHCVRVFCYPALGCLACNEETLMFELSNIIGAKKLFDRVNRSRVQQVHYLQRYRTGRSLCDQRS